VAGRFELGKDEIIVHKTSAHPAVGAAFACVLLGEVITQAILQVVFTKYGIPASAVAVIAIFFGMLALPVSLAALSSRFVLTNRRIMNRPAVGEGHLFERAITEVNGIEVRQDFLGVLLNYGDLVVEFSSGVEWRARNIRRPHLVVERFKAVKRDAEQAEIRRQVRQTRASGSDETAYF